MPERVKRLAAHSLILAAILASTACSPKKSTSSWEKVGEICQGYADRATHAGYVGREKLFPYIPSAYDRLPVAIIQEDNKFASIALIDPGKRQYIGTKPSIDCIAINPFGKDFTRYARVFELASEYDFLEAKERDLSLYWTELDKDYSPGRVNDWVWTYTFSIDKKNGDITAKRSGIQYQGNKPVLIDNDRYYHVGQKMNRGHRSSN